MITTRLQKYTATTLQHTATHCNTLPPPEMLQPAPSCIALQCVAMCSNVLQCVVMRCDVMQSVAVCCSVLLCDAKCCSVLQCVVVRCKVMHSEVYSHFIQGMQNLLNQSSTISVYSFYTAHVQGGVESQDALPIKVIFRKRALQSVALLRKMTCDLRHPMGFRHPVVASSFKKVRVGEFVTHVAHM